MTVKTISIQENILNANDSLAAQIRTWLTENRVFAVNMMASPGAGKTSLIERTISGLSGKRRVAIINGDTTAASMDAERAQKVGALAIHVNTGGNCHLEAFMVRSALDALDLSGIDLLIVENVGNLVCPSGWDLGTHRRVLVASIPEGADKPYKYPSMYSGVSAVVINKVDLLPYVPFDMDYFRKGIEALNPNTAIFPLSCTTGEGVNAWLEWLERQMAFYAG
ncbi:MAG: hydrogenase nickel incorporation protein HypB [Anaerolineae bacterium]|nr:hydrogenase nickel incorporation protein HypB [Anaerolineae bacterium]MDW8172001.1 hydrogenase nickel incorporation protein HypB [Anaerolineae bacterium]